MQPSRRILIKCLCVILFVFVCYMLATSAEEICREQENGAEDSKIR